MQKNFKGKKISLLRAGARPQEVIDEYKAKMARHNQNKKLIINQM